MNEIKNEEVVEETTEETPKEETPAEETTDWKAEHDKLVGQNKRLETKLKKAKEAVSEKEEVVQPQDKSKKEESDELLLKQINKVLTHMPDLGNLHIVVPRVVENNKRRAGNHEAT